MKIAIIGAGGAGLSAGRHCLNEGFSFDIFEQTGLLGGTWNYTDRTEIDENGFPVHSSMYKNLRTNLPKELMQYEDVPYPNLPTSYIYQPQVLEYILNFANKYGIEKYIKFFTRVVNVNICEDNKWSIEVENIKNKNRRVELYDAVIVCNGHFSDPLVPQLPGMQKFLGRYEHSHNYRCPKPYENKKVLIVGAGPSGTDIAKQIASVADKVFVSYKSTLYSQLPAEVISKPVVVQLLENEAEFEDGSKCEIDEILFCTGYHYTFPFLGKTCKIKVLEEYVHPLYKQVINIEQPTMAFIGLPFKICPFPLFDLQVRFFLSTLNGVFKLPSKEKMMKELEEEWKTKVGIPKRHFHLLGKKQGEYFEDLAATAGIKGVAPVIHKLFLRVSQNRNFEDRFEIIDDDNFAELK